MGEFGVVALVAVSAMAGAGLVLLMKGRAVRAHTGEPATTFDEDLEVQLTRASNVPGAELLLERLSRQPIIFARELTDFRAQLDNLERKAKVEAALSERRRAGSLPE